MTSLILTLGLVLTNELAQSYQDYFSTLQGQVFSPRTIIQGPKITHNYLSWKETRVSFASATVFPAEQIIPGDLGSHPTAYRSGKLDCIEGQAAASSGTAVRHFAIYVIDRRQKKPVMYKLPGMFGSCQNIREGDRGDILFDDINYRYEPEMEIPYGISFTEYRIDHGKFKPTGKIRYARFIEQENVWKFQLEN